MSFVYIGTYAKKNEGGIYVASSIIKTAEFEDFRPAFQSSDNFSFLAIHPNRHFLYSVIETGDFNGERAGAVCAFSINPESGKLTLLNKVSSRGAVPCHLVVDFSGKNVIVANYGGGTVTVLPLDKSGRLQEASASIPHRGSSINPTRQRVPHPHSVTISPDNRFALVPDLGLDKVFVYCFGASQGTLIANEPPFGKTTPGAGPRHCAFHPAGRFVYVLNELHSTITVFAYDSRRGILVEAQTLSTLPADFRGTNIAAEVQLHPAGRFLYASNRGHDSIAHFEIDSHGGRLALVRIICTQGKTPRHFEIHPTGSHLLVANQDSDSVVVFRIDEQSGDLVATGQRMEVGSPACVKFV